MSGDNSAKAKAERARLQKTLSDQRADLEEKQYQHSVETQEEALDKELENYQKSQDDRITILQESLEDSESIIADSFETVKNNAEEIGRQMTATAQKHGVEMSAALTEAWRSGENAIASYGRTLDAGASAFIVELEKVEFKTWELKAQADETSEGLVDMLDKSSEELINELVNAQDSARDLDNQAEETSRGLADMLDKSSEALVNELVRAQDSARELDAQAEETANGLADMFSTSADYLISELEASFNAEENLDYMTRVLQNSLIETLEGGYDVSGITGALGSIGNAADAVKDALYSMKDAAGEARDAANTATNAINAMKAAQSSASSTPTYSATKSKETWYVKSYDGSVVGSYDSYDEALKERNKHGGYVTSNKKYAKGLKKADEDELAWTQEMGDEILLSPSRSSILTPIHSGDSVLTADMTENLWKWAKMNPDIGQPTITEAPSINNIQTTQSMNFGSMISISGSTINDSVEMLKLAAQEASKQVTAGFKKLQAGLYS